MKTKVIKVDEDSIVFDNGIVLSSDHQQDCCESHYLSMSDLTIEDFDGLEFNLDNDNFFSKVEDYGIRLNPISGHSISIPGYGSNNGYYSSNLTLVLSCKGKPDKEFDITECQVIDG